VFGVQEQRKRRIDEQEQMNERKRTIDDVVGEKEQRKERKRRTGHCRDHRHTELQTEREREKETERERQRERSCDEVRDLMRMRHEVRIAHLNVSQLCKIATR
jgi:hypothetical protein